MICFDDDVPVVCLPCGHPFCPSCWSGFFASKIRDGKVVDVTCPQVGCSSRPEPAFVKMYLDEALATRYGSLILRHLMESRNDITFCANPKECPYVVFRRAPGFETPCTACGWRTCFACSFPAAHAPAACGAVSQWVDDGGYHFGMSEDQLSVNRIKMRTKRCPECQVMIEKNEGCQHMTCPRCTHEFCWRCLARWESHDSEACGAVSYSCLRYTACDASGLGNDYSQLQFQEEERLESCLLAVEATGTPHGG